jgi:hypothetical protein
MPCLCGQEKRPVTETSMHVYRWQVMVHTDSTYVGSMRAGSIEQVMSQVCTVP